MEAQRRTGGKPASMPLCSEGPDPVGPPLSYLLKMLGAKEERIVRMWNGVGLDRTYTLSEIAKQLNVTTSHIRQLKNRALIKLSALDELSRTEV